MDPTTPDYGDGVDDARSWPPTGTAWPPAPVARLTVPLPQHRGPNTWLVPDYVDAHGQFLMSIHTFVIEAEGCRMVVDICSGNSKDRTLIPEFDHQHRPFLPKLAAAGFDPHTIDIVVCTHLHVDHVGWSTNLVNGEWIPTFRRALPVRSR